MVPWERSTTNPTKLSGYSKEILGLVLKIDCTSQVGSQGLCRTLHPGFVSEHISRGLQYFFYAFFNMFGFYVVFLLTQHDAFIVDIIVDKHFY